MQRSLLAFYKVAKERDNTPLSIINNPEYLTRACKQALRMGYSEISFRIARGCAREESLQWSLYNLSSASFSA